MVNIFDGIFWGVVLIVLGVWFLVRRYVPFTIPVIRIIIAVLFVYLGVRVLVRGPVVRERNTVVFSNRSHMEYSAEGGKDYNVIFGNGDVDLTAVTVADRSVRADVNVIFGTGTLRINPAVPIRLDMSAAFGTIIAPNGRSVAFGDTVYTSQAYRNGAPALEIKATAVFGKLTILQ
jgi:hypothetical protein